MSLVRAACGWVVFVLIGTAFIGPTALLLAGPVPGPICKPERLLVRTADYQLKTITVPVCR